jgi:hypothetical protein
LRSCCHLELVQVHGMVSSMSFDRHHLYHSDSVRGTIERVGIDGKDKTILRSHLGSHMAVQVISDSIFWLTGGCSHICAPTPDGSKCLCPLGMDLDDSLYGCCRVSCRGDQWFKCNETCIPSKYRCDDIVDCFWR